MLTNGIRVHFVFTLRDSTPEQMVGTVVVPESPSPRAPVTVLLRGDSVIIAGPRGLRFAGVRSAVPDSIIGSMGLGGAMMPTSMVRLQRPQRVTMPVPYRTRELTVEASDSVRLSATLSLPAGRGPFPAVVLISGSGPQDRHSTIFVHEPFALIADHLARNGIATLRYDERGVGTSTGRYATATVSDLAADAEAVFRKLRSTPEIDKARVGLLGHSEGGIIAPQIAVRSRDVAFLVLLAAPAVRGDSVSLLQTRALAASSGYQAYVGSRQDSLNWALYQALRGATDSTSESAAVERYVDAILIDVPIAQKPALRAQLEPQARGVLQPEMLSLLRSDAQTTLRQVRVPVLALFGAKDFQVPAQANHAAMTAAFLAGGNARLDARIVPRLNHLFQPAQSGLLNEYFTITTTMDPAVLAAITAWIAGLKR